MTRPTTPKPMRQHAGLPEAAGATAHFAGWEVDLPSREVWWSEHLFAIFEMDAGPSPGVDQTIAFRAPEQREQLRAQFEACARNGDVAVEISAIAFK